MFRRRTHEDADPGLEGSWTALIADQPDQPLGLQVLDPDQEAAALQFLQSAVASDPPAGKADWHSERHTAQRAARILIAPPDAPADQRVLGLRAGDPLPAPPPGPRPFSPPAVPLPAPVPPPVAAAPPASPLPPDLWRLP